jgi:hypothetical protein
MNLRKMDGDVGGAPTRQQKWTYSEPSCCLVWLSLSSYCAKARSVQQPAFPRPVAVLELRAGRLLTCRQYHPHRRPLASGEAQDALVGMAPVMLDLVWTAACTSGWERPSLPVVAPHSRYFSHNWCLLPRRAEPISWQPRAWVWHNFISEEEADHLVAVAKPFVSHYTPCLLNSYASPLWMPLLEQLSQPVH